MEPDFDASYSSAKRAGLPAPNSHGTTVIPPCEIEAILDVVDAMSDSEVDAHIAALTREDLIEMLEFLLIARLASLSRCELIALLDFVIDSGIGL